MGDSFHPHTGLHTMESTPLEGKRKLRPNQAKKVANPTSIRHHGSEVRLSEQRPPSALRHLTSEAANNFHMSYDQVNANIVKSLSKISVLLLLATVQISLSVVCPILPLRNAPNSVTCLSLLESPRVMIPSRNGVLFGSISFAKVDWTLSVLSHC